MAQSKFSFHNQRFKEATIVPGGTTHHADFTFTLERPHDRHVDALVLR